MKKLLGLIALFVVVDGLILFFYPSDSSPPLPVVVLFFVCLALIAVGAILVLYRLWRYYCALTRTGKCLFMVWLIITLFVLIGLFPPVYNPKLSAMTLRGTGQRQNSFAFLFYMPHNYRISYRTLFVEWAIAIAIPVGVIATLRIKNRSS